MFNDTLLDDVRQKQEFLDLFCNSWISEYRQRGGIIHCAKGCSGCCSLVVNCTAGEALRIAPVLTPAQSSRLCESIPAIRNCAQQADSLKSWLSSYRDQAGPCPFLEQDGSCGVYQVRPFSCRSLLATREPHWCTTDFSTVSSEHKQRFMEGLDRSVASFPTHYVATTQELGQELELATLHSMEEQYGWSLLGNLPWLVWLTLEHRLAELLKAGGAATQQKLADLGLFSPYLTLINR